MKNWKMWLKGIIAVVFLLVTLVISPPIEISYAGHGDEILAGAAGGLLGAGCASMMMNQPRPATTTVIVTGHQHGPGCGHTAYDGLWYPNDRCTYYSNGEVYQCQ